MKYMRTFQSFYEEAMKEIKLQTYDLVAEPGFSESNGTVTVKKLFTYDLVADPGFGSARMEQHSLNDSKMEIKKELEIPSFPEYCQIEYEKLYNEHYTNIETNNIKEGDVLVWDKYKWTNEKATPSHKWSGCSRANCTEKRIDKERANSKKNYVSNQWM